MIRISYYTYLCWPNFSVKTIVRLFSLWLHHWIAQYLYFVLSRKYFLRSGRYYVYYVAKLFEWHSYSFLCCGSTLYRIFWITYHLIEKTFLYTLMFIEIEKGCWIHTKRIVNIRSIISFTENFRFSTSKKWNSTQNISFKRE